MLVLPFFTDVSQRICFSLEHECIVYSGSEIYPENMFRVVNEGEMLRDLHVKHCYSHFITDNNLKGRLYKSYILIKIIHPSLGNSNILVKINEFFLSTDITSVVTDQQVPPFYDFHHFIINNFSTSDITSEHYQTISISVRNRYT